MNMSDLDIENIKLNDPEPVDNSYRFFAKYDGSNDVLVQLQGSMHINSIQHDGVVVELPDETHASFLNKIKDAMYHYLYVNHTTWFEDEIAKDDFNKMSEELVTVGVNTNKYEMKCFWENDNDKNVDLHENMYIVPVLLFQSVDFDGTKFRVCVSIRSYDEVSSHETIKKKLTNEVSKEGQQVYNDDQYNEKQNEERDYTENKNDENNETGEDDEDDENEVEIEIDPSSLDEVKMRLDEEDIIVLNNMINTSIETNLTHLLQNEMTKKGIQSDEIDFFDILFDEGETDDEEDNGSFASE
jgi:hypothetical protein